MKITAFDDFYPLRTSLGGGVSVYSSGSNDASGDVSGAGDVVGEPADFSVVGLRNIVSLASNIGGTTVGDVLTIVSTTPRLAAFATPSNTGGAASFGSNATRVSEDSYVGALSTSAREDHRHDGIGTITASSSNTLQRGTVNLRPGSNVTFGLTDGDGDGELDTLTINSTATGGGGSIATLPTTLVQSKTGTTSTTLASTPTSGNTLIFLGGLNSTAGDSSTLTTTNVTWTKLYGTGSTNPSGSIWIGLVGASASTTVTTNSGVYFTVFEFEGQPWTPSLVASADNGNARPHIYVPSSSSSKAIIWVGLNSAGVAANTTGSPGEGLPCTGTAIAIGCMMPGGLSVYAMHGSNARSFYVEIN